eukprot:g6621.t1
MTRVTRSSGVKPEIDVWNLDELPKTRPAAKTSPLLTRKYTLKIPHKEREKDMRALRQAAKEYEKNTAAASPRMHEITGIPPSRFPAVADPETGEGQVATSMGLAVVMASRRYGAPSIALVVARDSGDGIGGGSVAIGLNVTTAGGSAAGGGDNGGGGGSSGDVHRSDGAAPPAHEGSLEGPSRGSLKRALDDAEQGGDSSPQQLVQEERARKRVKLNTRRAGNGGGGGGGGRARGGWGGGGSGRAAGTGSDDDSSGEKATLSGAATRATRKSGIPPITSLWDLPDLPKSRAAAKRAPSTKAYMSMNTGERPHKERDDDDDVPAVRGGAAREQDRGTAQIPAPIGLVTEYPTPIASVVSSLQAKATAPPPLVSTLDGETRDATTGERGSSSGSSSDGNAAARPAPPSTGDGRLSMGSTRKTGNGGSESSSSSSDGSWASSGWSMTTAGGSIPPVVHAEDNIPATSPGLEDQSSKEGDESRGGRASRRTSSSATTPSSQWLLSDTQSSPPNLPIDLRAGRIPVAAAAEEEEKEAVMPSRGDADDPEPGADPLLQLDTYTDEPMLGVFSAADDTADPELELYADSVLECVLQPADPWLEA